MAQLLASLISVLESTQTRKDVDADVLFNALSPVDVAIEDVSTIEASTHQRLVSVLCSWLRSHEDFQDDLCIRMILKILAKLLGYDANADSIAIQKGLLSSATELLRTHAGDALMIKGCLEVLATLSVVDSSDTILSRLNAVQIILELLQKHRDNIAVLEDVITTLALMAKRTRHRRAISQSGGVTALVDVLKRCIGFPSLVVAACRFLGNFAAKEECCLTVLSNGGVDALMAAFNNTVMLGPRVPCSSVDTRATVAAAIWTCSMDCNQVQDALVSSGWMASLAAVLQANPDHAGLHEAALGIIRGLSRTPMYREDIVNLGFVPAAIQAMRTFSDNTLLLKEACGFFGNMATDPDLRVQLGEYGVVQEVVTTLARCQMHEDRKLVKLALGALSNLASSEANRALLARANATQVLLGAARLFMSNENILEYAIGAISHIAVHDICNKQLAESGAVEALLLFVGEHREDLQVVSKSLVALRRLLRHASQPVGHGVSVANQIARAGRPEGCFGVYLLVEAMQGHMYDETVVKETALLLTSLSKNPSNVHALMAAAVQPCMKALEVHHNEVAVSDALAGLLSQLPLEDGSDGLL